MDNASSLIQIVLLEEFVCKTLNSTRQTYKTLEAIQVRNERIKSDNKKLLRIQVNVYREKSRVKNIFMSCGGEEQTFLYHQGSSG